MRISLALAWIGLLLAGLGAAFAADAPPVVDFGGSDNVINLQRELTPYHAPGGPEADGSVWYMLSATNNSVRPAIRVLLAGQPPRLALRVLPRPSRPAILAVASSDSGVVVEPAKAYGARAWRVIIPPVTQVGLAVRVGYAVCAALAPGLDRAGAGLPQPPARHLHRRGWGADRGGGADFRRACGIDRPYRAQMGGDHAVPAAVELAGRHRHVRCQSRNPYRRSLWPFGVVDGLDPGGGGKAGRRHRAPGRGHAAPCEAFSLGALWSVRIGGRRLSGRAGGDAGDRRADRAGQRRHRHLSVPLRPARHAGGASDRAQRRRLCPGGAGRRGHQPGRIGREPRPRRPPPAVSRPPARCFWRWR